MANSWNGPQLGSPIRTDVPELQKKLIALLKQDPTSVANIPSGAKRLVNTSGVQWQVQQYNGSSWAAIGKLMHDVDKLDGYHAAITPAASTVAVRNADKKLEGDITGNAATASSAATLSETLPVNKGGTGATTSAQARTNLGVPPTSHASSSTTYGLGSNANYGHVRGDGVTTNIVAGEVVVKDVAISGDVADLASNRGLLSVPFNSTRTTILDLRETYNLSFTGSSWNAVTDAPFKDNFGATVIAKFSEKSSAKRGFILVIGHSVRKMYIANVMETKEPVFQEIILSNNFATSSAPGIVKPGTGMSVDSAGSLGVDATVVRTSGSQNIEGAKKFTDLRLYSKSLSIGTVPESSLGPLINIYDSNGVRYSGVGGVVDKNGAVVMSMFAKPNNPDSQSFKYLRLLVNADGTSFAEAPTPAASSATNHIATTQWVRNYALPTGTLIPSLATSMTGYLLCNGAAVSRTTYANLFSIIGTKFGAGDGSTTFNLPDFRNRVFWGASGNLMSVIEAGLPNISGRFSNNGHAGGVFSSGAFYTDTSAHPKSNSGAASDGCAFNFDASCSNTIYGKSTTVRPPAIAVNIFIKY